MKLICCADIHIRSNRPQYRIDDYFGTVCRKFRQIIYLANKHNANIVCAGDIFDHTKVGHKVVNTILLILKKFKGKLFIIPGQHDMNHHSQDLIGSPFQTLLYQENIINLPLEPEHRIFDMQGCPFGSKVPKPGDKDSILVIHKSITPKDPPFFLTDAVSSREAFKLYPFKIIISGDYHIPFVKKKKGRVLINCGSIMRSNIDQVEHRPRVYLLDTESLNVKPLFLKIEKAEAVFALNMVKKKEESEFSKDISDLVETLKNKKNRPEYKHTVNLLLKEGNVKKSVRNKVNKILEEAHAKRT